MTRKGRGAEDGPSRKERRQQKEQARKEDLQEELRPLQQQLSSEDPEQRLAAARELAALLEDESVVPSIAANADIVRALLGLCSGGDAPVQFQALQALTFLSRALVLADAEAEVDLPALAAETAASLLPTGSDRTREQALAVLANMSGCSVALRDLVVERGAAKAALAAIKVTEVNPPGPVVQKFATFLCRLCSWEEPPGLGEDSGSLVNQLAVLATSNDGVVLVQALQALANLQYRDQSTLLPLVKHAVLERFIFLFEQPSSEVSSWAARAARKAAFSNMIGMQAFLLNEPIPALKEMLLREEEVPVQKAACFLLADILAVGGPHVQEVIDAGCLPLFVNLLRAGHEELMPAVVLAFAALSTSCGPQRMEALIEADTVRLLVAALDASAFQVVRPALRFFENLVSAGRAVQEQQGLPANRFAELLQASGVAEKLKAVMELSDDRTMCLRAIAILNACCA